MFVETDGAPRDRVRLCERLATKFNANLIGLSARAIRPPLLVGGIGLAAIPDGIPDIEARLAEKAKWFEQVMGTDRPELSWRSVIDLPVDALAREARSADLAVIGPMQVPGDSYCCLNPGEAILRLGRPALFVPNDVSSLRAEHVVIAWKDVREARRAVQDALPILHEATRVTIVEVCGSGDQRRAQARLDDVAKYLARHRIKSDPRVIQHYKGSYADKLTKFAQEEGADLLVSGAYGHSLWANGRSAV